MEVCVNMGKTGESREEIKTNKQMTTTKNNPSLLQMRKCVNWALTTVRLSSYEAFPGEGLAHIIHDGTWRA